MKKTFIIPTILTAAALGLASCDMNLTPAGSVFPENALQTIEDAERLRAGYMIVFRGSVSGRMAYTADLASDLYHATTNWGNRGGTYYNWIYTSVDGDAESVWSGRYSGISNLNFFIDKANSADKSNWTEENIAKLSVYKGEAFFLRAFYHFQLAEKFCQDYEGNESTYGIPYVKHYNPTSDQTQYPDRGTLAETFAEINNDLDSAEAYLTTPGAEAHNYLTADAVKALRARVALNMRDYPTAIENASALVNSGVYPLVSLSDTAAFRAIWSVDSGDEAIIQLDASYPDDLPSGYAYQFISYDANNDLYGPDYIPEQWVIDLYEEYPGDIRLNANFKEVTVTLPPGNAEFNVWIFYKFVGNPELKDQASRGNSGVNKVKPFRIPEQYLILAEAYARNGQAAEACNILNTLRRARIPGYADVTYSGERLLEEIFNERVRELMGEGFYWTDVKRYHRDIQRGAAQTGASAAIYLPSTNESFHRSWGDYRYVWPIPQEELDASPNIANQQNPGY